MRQKVPHHGEIELNKMVESAAQVIPRHNISSDNISKVRPTDLDKEITTTNITAQNCWTVNNPIFFINYCKNDRIV